MYIHVHDYYRKLGFDCVVKLANTGFEGKLHFDHPAFQATPTCEQ